jgi:hypothetical protein
MTSIAVSDDLNSLLNSKTVILYFE